MYQPSNKERHIVGYTFLWDCMVLHIKPSTEEMVLNVLREYLLGPLKTDPAHRRALGVADKWEALIPFIFGELCHRRVQHWVFCGPGLRAGSLGVSVSAHVPEQQHLQVPEEHTAAAALQHAAAALHPSLTPRRKELSPRGMLDTLPSWRYGKFNAALSQKGTTDLLIFLKSLKLSALFDLSCSRPILTRLHHHKCYLFFSLL